MSLPAEIAANPLLSQWVRIGADGVVEVFAGKVELGQGTIAMQVQIAADELDVPVAGLRLRVGDTAHCPDQGLTAGSLSTQMGGMSLRRVCAEVRQRFVEAAARRLGVAAAAVRVSEGQFSSSASSAKLGYSDLAADVDLDQPARADVAPKARADRRVAGTSLPRPDLPAKIFGAGFIHDIEWPGMLHGRVARPPTGASRLLPVDDAVLARMRALPGVQAVCIDGNWVGVVAQREEQAVAAAEALRKALPWDPPASDAAAAPDRALDDQSWLRDMDCEDSTVDAAGEAPDAGTLVHSIDCDYSRPYLAHGSIGPSCALARWDDARLAVVSHSQGVHNLRRELANYFHLPVEQVRVSHADGAGCYGHNGADDVAIDAAILSRAVGMPVRVQWSREEELSWSPFGPAMSVRIRAALDAQGHIAHWHHDGWSPVHVQRPGQSEHLNCLAARLRDPTAPLPPVRDFPLPGGGGQRNAIPLYALPSRRIDYHLVRTPPLRSSALRALGGYANVFAIESAMDELAVLAGQDPLAFRLAHLGDQRAAAVLQAVADDAGWSAPKGEPRLPGAARGRGLAMAQYKNSGAYCAVVVEIEVTDRIVVDRVWAAVDAGEVVNPDGLVNQVEGGIVQAASWTLKESVAWDTTGAVQRTWDDYPILGFDEAPRTMAVRILPNPDLPPLGAGECAAGPTAAAIANALFDALGLRARHLPLTSQRLVALMSAE